MFFSCLLVFVLAVLAIRRFFLGRRHLKSEFQAPRRKGDGPIIRSAKQTAAGAAATDAVAIAEAFESSSAALQATESDVAVKSQHEIASAPQNAEHEHVAALRRLPQLSVVTDQELARLAQHVRLVAVTSGETLFRAGEPANTAYIIKSGSVALSGGFDDGVDEIGSRQLATGECFGGEALELTETCAAPAVSAYVFFVTFCSGTATQPLH